MISETEAIEIATRFIADMAPAVDGGVAIVSARTLRKPYGWVFFYNAKRYLDTGDPLEGLGGNGPVVVEGESGRAQALSSSVDPVVAIMEFEKSRGFGD